ncbi:hypothetical protein [Zhaonella formicivorans]|uniref:hypothetical protein n=1 Tax=Zhaonella formicivorans TaxID=2528593 RepID=UPI001D11E4F9|nr:hypothetical protein [Zhaonella formicivorans]
MGKTVVLACNTLSAEIKKAISETGVEETRVIAQKLNLKLKTIQGSVRLLKKL